MGLEEEREEGAGHRRGRSVSTFKLITSDGLVPRVHVVLNMAASLDGRVAGAGGEPVQLSSTEDRERVHRLRAASDAIVVGSQTVLADDPRLTARPQGKDDKVLPIGQQPLRVIVAANTQIPPKARVLGEAAETLVVTTEQADLGEVDGAEVLAGPGGDQVDLAWAFGQLEQRGVERVLLEGGPSLAASALQEGLVDRFHLYIAPRVLGEGPSLAAALEDLRLELAPRARFPVGEGTLLSYGVCP